MPETKAKSKKSPADYMATPREQKIIDMVLSDFEVFKDALRDKHEKFTDFYEHYQNVVQRRRKPGQANTPTPAGAEAVDTIHADIVDKTISSTGILMDIVPTEGTDVMHAQASRELIQHQAYVQDMESTWNLLVKTALICGTAPAKICYAEEYATYSERQPIMDVFGVEIGSETVRNERLVYKGPKLIPVDVFDFFPHPDLVELTDDLQVIHRFIATPEMIRDQKEQGIFKNTQFIDWEETLKNEDVDSHHEKARRHELAGIGTHSATRKGIECYEWQGMYDLNDDGKRVNCVFVVTSSRVLLREDELPYDDEEKTYIAVRVNRVAGEFWGYGAIEKQHPMIHALNSLNRTALDCLYQSVHPKKLIRKKGIKNQSQLVNRQGQVIEIEPGPGEPMENYYKELPPMPVSGDIWQFMGTYQDWANKASRVPEFMKGYMPQKVQSATAVQTTFAQASTGFKLLLKEFEKTGTIDICRKMQNINLQFLNTEEVVGIIGRAGFGWRKITPQDIAGQVHFVALGSSREFDKGVNIQQLMQAIQIAQTNPHLQQLVPILFMALTDQFKLPHRDMIQDMLGWEQQKIQYYEQLRMQIAQQQMNQGMIPQIPEVTGNASMQASTRQIPAATNAEQLSSIMNGLNRTYIGG